MLFEINPFIPIQTEKSKLLLHRNFLSKKETTKLYNQLIKLDYEAEEYTYNNYSIKSLKKSSALGEKSFTYSYSGIHRTAKLWNNYPEIIELANNITKYINNIDSKFDKIRLFNFVLCNFYNNGKAGVGWHSDDESIINQKIPIASVSFGETRIFEITKNYKIHDKNTFLVQNLVNEQSTLLDLVDGDLVIMFGDFQREFLHRIVKDSSKNGRINLTFRNLVR